MELTLVVSAVAIMDNYDSDSGYQVYMYQSIASDQDKVILCCS